MTLSRSHSRISVEEEALTMKQGIVTILDSDGGERRREARAAAPIRRTLSADMSSKNWLEQNGMKKVVSSQEFSKLPISADSSSTEGEEEFEKFHRRSSVQQPAPPLADVWSSIMMSQKRNDDSLPPPYVHPLVKRSSSSLSEKSLEICTESLGSETGSDCFPAYCSKEEGKDDEIKILGEENNQFSDFSCGAAKYKKSAASARPSPPPIHSISASIHMNSHRENGRLVVEVVSVPPRNFFQAHRSDGRLVLSLIRTPSADEADTGIAEFENNTEEILEEEEGRGAADGDYEEEEELQSSGTVMTKRIAIGNSNPTSASDPAVEEEVTEFTVPQSLPPLPRASRLTRLPETATVAAASFNACEYFWRNMTAAAACGYINPNLINKRRYNGNVKGEENKAEYFGPYLRGCKEARTRRSMLVWEPYNCIAT